MRSYPGSGWFHRGSGRTRLVLIVSRRSHSALDRHPAMTSAMASRADAVSGRGVRRSSSVSSATVQCRRCTASQNSARTDRSRSADGAPIEARTIPRTASTSARAVGATGIWPGRAVGASSSTTTCHGGRQSREAALSVSIHHVVVGNRLVRCTRRSLNRALCSSRATSTSTVPQCGWPVVQAAHLTVGAVRSPCCLPRDGGPPLVACGSRLPLNAR